MWLIHSLCLICGSCVQPGDEPIALMRAYARTKHDFVELVTNMGGGGWWPENGPIETPWTHCKVQQHTATRCNTLQHGVHWLIWGSCVQPGDGPIALMLAPTRELALQIHEVGVKYGESSNIKLICVYGGAPKGPQAAELKRGVSTQIWTYPCDITLAATQTTHAPV